MKLYEIIDFVPVPTEEWMAMEVAQKLYTLVYNKGPGDADGRKRVRGTKEMVYIYFFCDYRSEFHNYPDNARNEESLSAAGLPNDHPTSVELLSAMGVYAHHISAGSQVLGLLEAARTAVDKLKNNFSKIRIEIDDNDSLDIMEKKMNITGKLMDNLGKIPKVMKDLDAIEERVKKEASSTSRLKGGAEKGRL